MYKHTPLNYSFGRYLYVMHVHYTDWDTPTTPNQYS